MMYVQDFYERLGELATLIDTIDTPWRPAHEAGTAQPARTTGYSTPPIPAEALDLVVSVQTTLEGIARSVGCDMERDGVARVRAPHDGLKPLVQWYFKFKPFIGEYLCESDVLDLDVLLGQLRHYHGYMSERDGDAIRLADLRRRTGVLPDHVDTAGRLARMISRLGYTVDRSTIHRWYTEGYLGADVDEHGYRLFRLSDVLELLGVEDADDMEAGDMEAECDALPRSA